ncbi:5-(carboxyamino)imidazole ribonucleotide mutase [Psychrobacter aquaticus]|uniref:N5-carboxyaminoimidazole ribonucleotide mutase n=1 Tax=Psychrobacter aquaticus CMS 56 TaxID=1354303 RepID=U4T3S3_9GAMM|nr:5-(carboxyamino)imidazole ribonucleotide mutase [Psychrobacter aquaticus]ERL55480.1 Phosphoribosylaminoimidazole carboxylase catalytic subunit [Psychrobacter aquaticus CMS 56]
MSTTSATMSATIDTVEQNEPITSPAGQPKVGIIMGSQSDWATMSAAAQLLADFDIAFACEVVSAHRTPDRLFDYAKSAKDNGLQVIIAGAGGAAHLPGMCASQTPLPVFGVPVKSSMLSGWDSLLSIVQMPKGVAVGTLAIGTAGAYNAALLAIQVLALHDESIATKLDNLRKAQTETILASPTPGIINV